MCQKDEELLGFRFQSSPVSPSSMSINFLDFPKVD